MDFYKVRGFAWLPVLLIVGVVVIGGGAWAAYHINEVNNRPMGYGDGPAANNSLVTQTPATSAVSNTPIKVNINPVSVPGMSKYTDTEFGFSFWYPSSMQSMVQKAPPTTVAKGYEDSAWINGPGTQILGSVSAPEFTAYEVNSPDKSILSSVDAGCCGSNYDKYFFDTQTHAWMKYDDGGSAALRPAATTTADVSSNTMGGLHIFLGYTRFGIKVIIPLSAQHFLVLYAKCSDASTYGCNWDNTNPSGVSTSVTKFKAAIQTIVATDPSAANPVSAAEQIKVIQAEKNAYTNQ